MHDSAQDVLSGCNNCGKEKFQFVPEDRVESDPGSETNTELRDDAAEDDTDESEKLTPDSRGWPETATADHDGDEHGEGVRDSPRSKKPSTASDDEAQARSRSVMVDSDDLPEQPVMSESDEGDEDDIIVAEPDEEAVVDDPEEVKDHLNEQFGSIKIVEPGKFQLDLMEMYESDDQIITLEEDGRYTVESLSTWKPSRNS